MIIQSLHLANNDKVGAKARNLGELQTLGLQVPLFFVATADTPLVDILAYAQELFVNQPVIIRSSAQGEDTDISSMAGQFMSCVAGTVAERENCLQQVFNDAQTKLGTGWQQQFAVIVQQYIKPDYAGVLFTRNPNHGLEHTLEYVEGAGEQLVSGIVTGKKITWMFTDVHAPKTPFVFSYEVKKQIEIIEQHFGHPQDIEWCVKNGQWYWLQSRPITTISAKQYQQYLRLEQQLPVGDYVFKQTELSEQLPTPNPFQFSLLQAVYGASGPVEQLYNRFGIVYKSADFLRIFDGWLYVNKQAELQQFLPGFSYRNSADKPSFVFNVGMFATIKNLWKLNGVSSSGGIWHADSPEDWCRAVLATSLPNNLEAWWQQFSNDYQAVVHIGLLADKYEKKLRPHLQRLGQSLSALLQIDVRNFIDALPADYTNWKGNGLDVLSETNFKLLESKVKQKITVTEAQQKVFGTTIIQLTRWVTLKEVARWITVKHMNHLLTLLPDDWQQLSFSDLIKGSTVKLDTVKITMTAPPRMLTNLPFKQSDIRVLSEGSILGLGVTMQQLPNTTKPAILIVHRLSPDLVQHFTVINGILSTNGSQLSHLAIMAREHGVPVRVMPDAFTYVGQQIDFT